MESEINEFEGIEVLEWSCVSLAPEKNEEKTESVEKEVEKEKGDTSKGLTSNITDKAQKKSLYSEVLKGKEGGKRNGEKKERPSYSRYDHRRRNVVRLHYTGENIPDRDVVGKELLINSLWFTPLHIFALIHVSGSRDYDISFRNAAFLDMFWARYEEVKNNELWKDFVVIKISENSNRYITILFKTEAIPSLDISFWLRTRCKEVGNLKPIFDRNGFWNGGYNVAIKLYSTDKGLAHLPNFITIGNDRGFLFYPGQPKVCHKCGSGRHFGADCTKVCCARCGQVGHFARDCKKEIKCNLCGEEGHIY
uniref:CCHC-type domain-containing protein n=1 Tax=Latimeria chalumnae TaxID=7897 RepID=H3AW55_LATCH